MNRPLVFNIQRFSVHDGPGIRTTVFLQGCPLRCRWCHNPESWEARPQLQFFADNCAGCGACVAVCPPCARTAAGLDRALCTACGACARVCTHDALKLSGREMPPEEVMDTVRRDKLYFDNSGGGLTVSGGEPLLYPDFCASLFSAARREGIHTALDTAAAVPWEHFEAVLPYVNAVLLDLKMMDGGAHKTFTGSSNEQILENARRLFSENTDLYVRVPVIDGVNDTKENARLTADFLKGAARLKDVTLLPYHGMGAGKALSLGVEMETFRAPSEETLAELYQFFTGAEK